MMVSRYDKVSRKCLGRIGMTMEIPDIIDKCSIHGKQFVPIEKPFQPRVMISGCYPDRGFPSESGNQ